MKKLAWAILFFSSHTMAHAGQWDMQSDVFTEVSNFLREVALFDKPDKKYAWENEFLPYSKRVSKPVKERLQEPDQWLNFLSAIKKLEINWQSREELEVQKKFTSFAIKQYPYSLCAGTCPKNFFLVEAIPVEPYAPLYYQAQRYDEYGRVTCWTRKKVRPVLSFSLECVFSQTRCTITQIQINP